MGLKSRLSFWLKRQKQKMKNRSFKSFGEHAYAVVAETNFGLMICDNQDSGVSRQLLKWGDYNPNETKKLLEFIEPNSKVLVVGAHIGSVVIPLSKKAAEIKAIEANPRNFSFLKSNVALNSIQNTETYNFAATERECLLEFLMSKENSGGSKIKPISHNTNFYYDKPECVNVEGFALDEVFDPEFDLVLMDIEGSEYSAIKGAKKIINNSRVFIVEFIPDHVLNVAGVSIESFANLLLEFDFSRVIFPRSGVEGRPADVLLSQMLKLNDFGEYEDSLIFTK